MTLPFLQQFVNAEEFADAPHVHIPEPDPIEPMTAGPLPDDFLPDAHLPVIGPPEEAAPVPEPAPAPVQEVACTPRNLVSALFSARDKAHQLHLRTRSFSAHIALGELYEGLLALADQIAEVVQGKYGVMEPVVSTPSPGDDPVIFIHELASWAETAHAYIPAGDSFIANLIDEMQALVYRAKYKLDNLH
jgi:hypothetical protein